MSNLKTNIQGTKDARLEDGNSNEGILRSSVSNSDIPYFGARDGETTITTLPIIEKLKVTLTIDGKYVDDDVYGNMIVPYEFIRVYVNTPNKENVDIKVTKVLGFTTSPDTTTIEGIIIKGDANDIIVGDRLSWVFYQQEKEEFNFPNDLYAGNTTSNSAILKWEDSTPFKEAKFYQVMWRELGTTNWLYSPLLNLNIYTITGLISNTTYEWSVMSYLSNDLKTYSRYAPSLKFTTR